MLVNQPARGLFAILSGLALLSVLVQSGLFFSHYRVSDLVDSLVGASIAPQLFHPVILLPVLGFFLVQCLVYGLFILFVWFLTVCLSEWAKLSARMTSWLGCLLFCFASFCLLACNRWYFPDSLFAHLMSRLPFAGEDARLLMTASLQILLVITALACVYACWFRRHRLVMLVLLACVATAWLPAWQDARPLVRHKTHARPDVILIGLDSLRPDVTGFYGKDRLTPQVDQFLGQSVSFSSAYTPLARTFPAWVSILTGKYPRHHHARNNLIAPDRVTQQETLAKRLQQAGYETVYATDEKRFSNVTEAYGFDRILGPRMGVDDFLLGGLSDFPLTNLLVNLPLGRFLFPWHYGNRAATVTYQPDSFLHLVRDGLVHLPDKPVFLTVHLCLSHWPHKWADSGRPETAYLSDQYLRSVAAVDRQFGALLVMLKQAGLLENSWVVLLSDHGTALGLKGDRLIAAETYRGDKKKMAVVPVMKLASKTHDHSKPVYSLNTSYGQGTNVLSLTQNHVLLAFRRFGEALPARQVSGFASLIDIAPTLLDVLNLDALKEADGLSLRPGWVEKSGIHASRPFFIETGATLAEIETDHIYIEKVIRHQIGVYRIHPQTGLLSMQPRASQAMLGNKQRAVLSEDWMLAHFPARKKSGKIYPPYFVLANVKTGEWTVELDSNFAKKAPVHDLLAALKGFYGEEF